MAFGRNKEKKSNTARRMEQPDPERRKELKADPRLANTIDEEIWITRSRTSSLNGAINGILAGKQVKDLCNSLSWGIASEQLSRALRKSSKFNPELLEDSSYVISMIKTMPKFQWVEESVYTYEDQGVTVYTVFGCRGDSIICGLSHESRNLAWISLLCAFGINALISKLELQMNEFNREVMLDQREAQLHALKGPQVPKAFSDDDDDFTPEF